MMPRRAGFTLVELLISLAILALVAVLSYRALASLTDSESKLTAEARHWRDLDAMFARIEADVRAAIPREARTDAGADPPWLGDADEAGNARLRFSRAGSDSIDAPGSAGQRIGYRLRDGSVHVLYWPRLDQPAAVAPQVYALADGVVGWRVAYLDARGGWRQHWPVPGEPAVPRAVRLLVTLAGGAVIERWLALR